MDEVRVEIVVDDNTAKLIQDLLNGKMIKFNGTGNGGEIRSIARQFSRMRNKIIIARDDRLQITIMQLLEVPKSYERRKYPWGGFRFKIF